MASSYNIGNFPNKSTRRSIVIEFLSSADINGSRWTWTETGATGNPLNVDSLHGGGVTVLCDSNDNDTIMGVWIAEFLRFNRLGQTYKIIFEDVTVSDDDQIDWFIGAAKTPSTDLLTLVTDGIFVRHVDGETDYRTGHAYNAATTGDYSEHSNGATDASQHTYAIQVETDPTTLGTANVVFFKDGAVLDSYPTTTLPHDEELAVAFQVQNGEAVAKSISIGRIIIDMPSTA